MTQKLVNPTSISWVPETANVDPTKPFDATKEITGFHIGIRSLTAAGSIAGTYPIVIPIADPKATQETFAQASAAGLAVLKDDDYQISVQSTGPANSAFAVEDPNMAFTIQTIPPTPAAPTFTVA